MLYDVTVTGRRLVERDHFELRLEVAASTERAALDEVEAFDWSNAATRHVVAVPRPADGP